MKVGHIDMASEVTHILFMPVKYLVNVPKDNLILALHVIGYTLLLHPAHVALQVHMCMVTIEAVTHKT